MDKKLGKTGQAPNGQEHVGQAFQPADRSSGASKAPLTTAGGHGMPWP
ncbi:MAG: hypothetical protein RBU37_08645 [Myxococcota bacterium]|nr:hypothetical protein [Myxococcota bacterium]